METFKTSNELNGDLRSGMEDIVNNPLLTEMYNISKTYVECIQQMHRIFPGQFCSTERTLSFDQNVIYCENSKSKDFSKFLAEFESIRTRVLKINDQTRISSLQDKIVSSSVDNVSNSRERAPSSKDRHSVRDRRLQKRHKNHRIQKETEPSCIKKDNFSDISLLPFKVEMKTQPSNQYNFQFGKTRSLDEIPITKSSSAYNIQPSTSPKKRKYKVKVKVQVHRKKLKREAPLSPPPPPPPPPPPANGPSVSNIHPSTSSKFKYKAKIHRKKLKCEALPPPPPPPPPPKLSSPPPPPPPKLSSPPPPPPKLPPPPRPPPPKLPSPPSQKLSAPPPAKIVTTSTCKIVTTSPTTFTTFSLPKLSPPSRLPAPPPPKMTPPPTKLPQPPPHFPRLPLPPQAGYSSQLSYPKPIRPMPPILQPIPAFSSFPRPFIPDSPFGNSKSRSITSFLPHSREIQTTSCHQLQQVLQTSQCNMDRMHDLQTTEQNIPGAIHNYHPAFFNAPHTLLFHSNYPSTFNRYIHIRQQYPAMPYANKLPN